MTAFGKIIKGRAPGVRCDGCGRISKDDSGYYFDRKLNAGGNITSKGRECSHDFCDECEDKNPDSDYCPTCKNPVPDAEHAEESKRWWVAREAA